MLSTEVNDRRVDVDGVSVRLLEAGAGEGVLLLHGGLPGSAPYSGSAELWRPWIGDLAGGNHVLAPDLPGCGGTSGERDEHLGIAGTAELLVQLLAQLDVGAAHVVAHGDSALVALRLARTAADVVASCTLVAGHQVAPTNEAVENLTCAHPPVSASPAARQGWALDRLSSSSAHITPQLLQALADPRDGADAWRPGPGFDGRRRSDVNREKAELYEFCREGSFAVPVALVWGAEDPSTSVTYGYEITRILAASAASLEFHVLNRVGHFPFREDPAQLTRVTRSIWQSAPARRVDVPVGS